MTWLLALVLWLVAVPAFAGTATISWTPPTQATDGTPLTGSAALTGYRLYERCGSAQYGVPISLSPTLTSYVRTGLPDDTTCYWQLTAVNAGGESARSNEGSKTFSPSLPGAPGSLVITWQATATPPTGPPDMAVTNALRHIDNDGRLRRTANLPSSSTFTAAAWIRISSTQSNSYRYGLTLSVGVNAVNEILWGRGSGAEWGLTYTKDNDWSLEQWSRAPSSTDGWIYAVLQSQGVGAGQTRAGYYLPSTDTWYWASNSASRDSFTAGFFGVLDSSWDEEALFGDSAFLRVWNAYLTEEELDAERLSTTRVRNANIHYDWPMQSLTPEDISGNDYLPTFADLTLLTAEGPPIGASYVVDELAPNETLLATGWTTTPSGAVHSVLDEATADDDDYATTTDTSPLQLGFEAGTAEPFDYVGIKLRARGAGAVLDVELFDGSSLLGTFATDPLTSSFATTTFIAGALTDYGNLSLQISQRVPSFVSFYGNEAPDLNPVPDPTTYTLGQRFSYSSASTVAGVRFRKGNGTVSGNFTAALYRQSDQALLASKTVNVTTSGWIEIEFDSPVSIAASTDYVAAIFRSSGGNHWYTATESYLTSSITRNGITFQANGGVFNTNTSLAFPSSTYNSSSYFIEPLIRSGLVEVDVSWVRLLVYGDSEGRQKLRPLELTYADEGWLRIPALPSDPPSTWYSLASDDFNRADGLIGTRWSNIFHGGHFGDVLSIASNNVRGNALATTTLGGSVHVLAPPLLDQAVSFELANMASPSAIYAAVLRANDSGLIFTGLDFTTGRLFITEATADSQFTDSSAGTFSSFTNGEVVRAEVVGDQVTVSFRGTDFSRAIAQLPTNKVGYPGLLLSGGAGASRADNFELYTNDGDYFSALHTAINETVADDDDYIVARANGTIVFPLEAGAQPEPGDRTLRYRARGSGLKRLVARLLEGTAEVESWTVDPLPTNFTLYERLLTGEGDIADYSNLSVEFQVLDATAPSTIAPNPAGWTTAVTTIGTASASWAINFPAHGAGDLLVAILTWDDSTTVTSVSPPTVTGVGWKLIGPVASASTEIRMAVWAAVFPNSASAQTRTFTPSASETLRAVVVAIPAGTYNTISPVGWYDTRASAGTAESTLRSPTGTALWNDAGGRLLIAFGSDVDPITAPTSGTTTVNNGTGGGVGLCVVTRNAQITSLESIAEITATMASDSWASIALVIRPPEIYEHAAISFVELELPPAGSASIELTVGDSQHGHVADGVSLTQAQVLASLDSQHGLVSDSVVLTQGFVLGSQDSAHAHVADSIMVSISASVAPEDSIHQHVADALGLIEAAALVSQDSAHAHVADSAALTQASLLASQDSQHTHAADGIEVAQDATLTGEDSVHAHVADSAALTQASLLTSQDSQHAHVADGVEVAQDAILIGEDSAHSHIADATALTQASSIAALASAHAHTAESVTLTEAATLTSFDSIHALTSDDAGLSQSSPLAVDRSVHAHVAGLVELIQAALLGVESAAHAQAADGPTLAQATVLVSGGSVHLHTAEVTLLSEAALLGVAGAAHAHSADAVTLGVAGVLGIQDAVHAHVSDATALVQAGALIVGDSAHSLVTAQIALSPGFAVTVADSIHAHAVGQPGLTSASILAVDSAAHLHVAGLVQLTESATIIVSDAVHAQIAATISLVRPGEITGADLFLVFAEGRLFVVAPEERLFILAPEERLYRVH